MMLTNIRYRLQSLFCFVIADAKDNSVTFSKTLFHRLGIMKQDEAKIIVFRIPGEDCYAFALNPVLDQPTHLAEVMYNGKYRCVGFECLVPTVNRIFYDYGIPADIKCKLSVRKAAAQGQVYYKICKPYGKPSRK